MSSVNTILGIVEQALIDLGESGHHKYTQFLSWALSAYRDIDMEVVTRTKEVELPVNDLRVTPFPQDYLDYVVVGIKQGERVFPLGKDSGLTSLKEKDDCGNEKPNKRNPQPRHVTGINTDSYDFWGTFPTEGEKSSESDHIKNIGPDYIGYFIEDRPNRRFQFSTEFTKDKVYIKYLATMEQCSADTNVDQFYYQPILEYIHWKRCLFSTSNKGQARYHEKRYYEELKRAKRRAKRISYTDLVNSVRKQTRLTVKA